MAGRIRESILAAMQAGIGDPTFVTLGKEVRTRKLLLDGRFEGVRDRGGCSGGGGFKGAKGG